VALDNLAAVALERGDVERSRELVAETLRLVERLGDRDLIAFALEKAAVLAALQNEAVRAGRLAGAADALPESGGFERSRCA
jgi:hypothetical protein